MYAQIFGPEQLITDAFDSPNSFILGDIDGDMLPDIVVGFVGINPIVAWSKNLGGNSFGDFQQIGVAETRNISLADLDGDGDLDVLVPYVFVHKFAWFENLDGLGTFGTGRVVDTNTSGAYELIGGDIDGDGDVDLIGAIDLSGSVVWYENLDGLGTFGPRTYITFTLNGCRSIVAQDMDNDGDLDVIAATGGNKTVVWFENQDGFGNFSDELIVEGEIGTSVSDIKVIDIDGDGDMDILAVSGVQKIYWYENLDGQGAFGIKQLIVEDIYCGDLFSTDLDNDGDNDVLYYNSPSVNIENSELIWSENIDGLGTFGPKQIIGQNHINLRFSYASDIDNDGDQDVFTCSNVTDKIVWYENLTILGVTDIDTLDIKIYPNPVNEVLVIKSPIPIQRVCVFTILGSKLLEVTENFNEISMTGLPSGLLLVEIETAQGHKQIYKLLKI
ncbi:MAG: hypothetical protein CVU03_01915 [Bacteroidetes bacterium HGW-Bacteroidetes-2]|jgi:hypothetical protein|nr:MAG: hypothetical protein CVU13_06400 [Bacteroidetes bacterium HGW-Bacteroidetes-8]PKP26654.1 MAG: hypothetical protein CVU03_01915 [Bacteroidetes bacterium HGW-Bacteroidetes-2]